MNRVKQLINNLQFVRAIYWLFLTYMIAAFIWWYVSLENQNAEIASVKYESIRADDPAIYAKVKSIESYEERKKYQYLGEGLTFLFLFLLGAIYVYRTLLKQINYSAQQQNFMMAVTHELKTPIAISHLNLETLLKRALTPEQQKKIIEVTLQETQRLDSLCNNILLASQLDMGQYQTNKQLIDLSNITSVIVKSFQERYPQRNWVSLVQEAVLMEGEPVLIQLLLNNLLENAHKYASVDTPVSIELFTKDNKIVLNVKDQGVGILPNEREKIFEKFYRIGTEFTRSTKGTGLGLYLCKRIADFHNASLSVASNQPNGSIFTFTHNV
jgi:K+-sensing histidine kinase KdpD